MAYSIATSASHHTLNESPSEKEGKLMVSGRRLMGA